MWRRNPSTPSAFSGSSRPACRNSNCGSTAKAPTARTVAGRPLALYRTQDGSLHTWEDTLPFSCLLDGLTVPEEAQVTVTGSCGTARLIRSDGAAAIGVELTLSLLVRTYETVTVAPARPGQVRGGVGEHERHRVPGGDLELRVRRRVAPHQLDRGLQPHRVRAGDRGELAVDVADPGDDACTGSIAVMKLPEEDPTSGEVGYWAHPAARGRGARRHGPARDLRPHLPLPPEHDRLDRRGAEGPVLRRDPGRGTGSIHWAETCGTRSWQGSSCLRYR